MRIEKRMPWWWLMVVAVALGTEQQALGQQVEPWATLKGHTEQVLSLAFSPDGRTLVSASYDCTVKLWEVLTRSLRVTLKGHTGGVYTVAFAPDGKRVASGDNHGVVRLWDPAGKALGSLKGRGWGKGGYVECLAFSPDGKTLAVGRTADLATGELGLWDVRAGRQYLTLSRDRGVVSSVSFSPNGRLLAGGDAYGYGIVTLWKTASGKVRSSLRGREEIVWSVAFISDGLLASANDGTVSLWDLRAGKERAVLKGHDNRSRVNGLAVAGKLLASSRDDGTVCLWDTGTAKQLLMLKLDDEVRSVALSADGRLLAVGDTEGTIRIWQVSKLLAQKGKR
jgi:WD40 repeat protein